MYPDFARRERRYDDSFKNASRSLQIATLAGPTTPWVAATLFYMGDIKLWQGKAYDAM